MKKLRILLTTLGLFIVGAAFASTCHIGTSFYCGAQINNGPTYYRAGNDITLPNTTLDTAVFLLPTNCEGPFTRAFSLGELPIYFPVQVSCNN